MKTLCLLLALAVSVAAFVDIPKLRGTARPRPLPRPACEDPTVWKSISDLAIISTAASSMIFIFMPFWYCGLSLSEAACKKIDSVYQKMKREGKI